MQITKRNARFIVMVASSLSFFAGRATSIFYLSTRSEGNFNSKPCIAPRNEIWVNKKDSDGEVETKMHCIKYKDNMDDNNVQEMFPISKRHSFKSTMRHWESKMSPQRLETRGEDDPSTQPKDSLIHHHIYAEALVHPAMFAHPNPERVAIIGGRNGSSLREVLKHRSVNEVKMIQTNKQVVKVLPEFGIEVSQSECNNVNIHDDENCEEEEVKIDLYYEDAVSWMKDCDEDAFDALFIDVRTPSDYENHLNRLHADKLFMHALYKSLSPVGVIGMQLGMAPFGNDPADQFTSRKWRSSLIATLEQTGFKSIHVYEDANCALGGPVLFLVASKDELSSSKELWIRSSALMELEIRKRMYVASELPSLSLQYFDSGVMGNFFNPHKSFEIVFCRSIPIPKSCSYTFHERLGDIPLSTLDVHPSTVGDGSGRGVFTTVNIKKGSIIGRDARRVVFYPSSVKTIFEYMKVSKTQLDVYKYLDGYGWQSHLYGDNTFIVEKSILTFANHGCNGEYNIGSLITCYPNVTEQTATLYDVPTNRAVYDPFLDRREHTTDYMMVALSDIKAGEELLCNYVYLTVKDDEWWDEVQTLKRICNKKELGLIALSEAEKNNEFASSE